MVCLFPGLYDSIVLANDASMISQLNSWLSPKLRSSYSYWKLCYRASVDGWRSRTFHNRCDNKGPTVTIVRVGSYIFGGYNDDSWQGKFSNMVSMTPWSSFVENNVLNLFYNSPVFCNIVFINYCSLITGYYYSLYVILTKNKIFIIVLNDFNIPVL